MPSTLKRLVLALFLAWSAFAFLVEMNDAVEGYDRRETLRPAPVFWRSGLPQVGILETCLAEAREIIPPGSVVMFVSPPGQQEAEFYRWRWAAYLLPENDVIQPSSRQAAQYLITHRQPFDHPRAELVRPLTGCRLYRILPP